MSERVANVENLNYKNMTSNLVCSILYCKVTISDIVTKSGEQCAHKWTTDRPQYNVSI
jgi:hypothetical protein